MKLPRGPVALLAFCFLALLATGCRTTWPATDYPPTARVVQEGVVIEAEDKSFTLDGSRDHPTPFRLDWEYVHPFTSFYPCTKANGTSATMHSYYLKRTNARRVRVTYPGLDKPLYGILALCPAAGSGPTARTYLISVPREYIDATKDGGIATVYERIGPRVDWIAWILYLSQHPFQ
jgi:hypothetical protein